MSEQLHEMLAFVLEHDVGLTKARARSLASHFADVQEFLDSDEKDLTSIKSVSGRKAVRLSEEEVRRILDLKRSGLLSPALSVAENFLAAIGRAFTRRQLEMIRGLSLTNMNPNPFLIKTLNLKTPEEVVRLNVYMFATRSIVTSMGFFIEKLLLSTSDTIEKGPTGSGWDLLKTEPSGQRHWIQVKSGPNDMDKDQIVYWSRKIQEKITEGDRAYIGITYGKRTNNTVTLGLMKQLLPDWEMKTLIGRELWDFLNDNPTYTAELFRTLQESAQRVLNHHSISEELERCIERVKGEFVRIYGDGEEGVVKYISDIF